MSKSDPDVRRVAPAVWRYGLSVLSVAISTAVTIPLQVYHVRTSLFFPAVLLTTWFGGTGPGLLAVVLSTLSINFFFREPPFQFQLGVQDIPHTVAFLFTALLISSWSTARKRAESRLRESEQRWRGLTEALPQLVWGARSDGACDYFSTQWTEYTGVPESDLLGWQWMKLLHPDDRERTRKFWTDSVAGRAPYDVEYRVQRKDGVYGWFKTRGVPIRDEEGNIEKWFGTCTDITDRKQAEVSLRESENELRKAHDELEGKVNERTADLSRTNEALRTSEEKYRDLINASPDAVCVIDAEGKCVLVNPAGVDLAGRPEHELIGSSITDTYVPEESHLVRDRIDKLKAEGSLRFERKFVRGNGDVIPVEVSLSALRGRFYQAIIRDISRRNRREALLAGENRVLEMVAKGDSLADILENLCRLVEELSSGVLASILLMDPNGRQLRHGAAPNLPKAYIDAIDGAVIGPAVGSCGTAAYRAEPVIVSDIASDPLWTNYRDVALTHGLRACWSTPILSSEGKVLGTFAIYYREPRNPTPQQHEIIDQITHLASIALERKRAENALHASEQLARGQVEALAQNLDILATTPAPENLIGQMLSTIGRFMNAQSVVLWLLDESSDSLVLRAAAEGESLTAADSEHPFIKDPRAWKSAPWLGDMFFTGVPAVVEEIEDDPRVSSAMRDYFRSKGTRKLLEVPTLVAGDVKGFIGIRHGDRPAYRPEEIELAQALAHQAMFAIQFNQFAEQSQTAAVLEERNRMARDIHDTLAQGFTGVIVQLEAAEDATSSGHQKETNKHLHRAPKFE
jgi:PAS domain S-box-containing protein